MWCGCFGEVWFGVMCCAMLSCAVLCCVVLCCAVDVVCCEVFQARFALTTCDIGEDYVECDPNPIYISESLTVTRKKLFRSCLKFKKEFKLHAVSTSSGRIYIKEEKKKRRVYIDSETDLDKLRKQISARSFFSASQT